MKLNSKPNSNTIKFLTIFAALLVISVFLVQSVKSTGASSNDAPATTVAPGTENILVMDFTIQDGGDIAIANSPSPGDGFTAFDSSDNVYFHNDSSHTGWNSADNDALWKDNDDYGTYEASGRSIGGTITLMQKGFSEGTVVKDAFVFVADTNEDIVFSDDGGTTTYTADLTTDGELTGGIVHSGSAVASAIKTALESKAIGSDTFTVSYDQSNDKFSIQGDDADGDGNEQLLWANSTTTAETTLGYDATDTTDATTSADVSDSAVAFNVISETNGDFSFTIDGTPYTDKTVTAGAYTGTSLATELESVITAVETGVTVDYGTSATDAFTITSATDTLSDTPVDSSVTVEAGTNDIAAGIGFSGSQTETNGYVTITDGSNDDFNIDVDGGGATLIDIVTADTNYDDADTLVSDINAQISGATASWDTDHIVIKSDSTGLSSSIVITTGTNDATTIIGYGGPTERTGDAVVADPNDYLTTEVTTGTELPSDNIKYVDSGGDSGAFDTGEPVGVDTDTNGVYQDIFTQFKIQNGASTSKVDNSTIDALQVWKDDDDLDLDIDDTEVTGSVSWDPGNSIWTLDITDQDITADTTFFVGMDVTSPLSDTYSMEAETTSMSLDSGDSISVTNTNTQTVDGTPPDITSATTQSTDTVQVTIEDADSKVDVSTIENTDFEVGGGSVDSISGFSSNSSSVTGTLTVSSSFGTGDTPNVDIVSGIDDTLGNTESSETYSSTNDGVAPVVSSAMAEDTDSDGHLNKITLTLSEGLTNNNPGTGTITSITDFQGMSLTINDNDIAADGASTSSFTAGSQEVVIELDDTKGTTGQPSLSYDPSSGSPDVKDDASARNKLASTSPTITDSAAPVAMTTKTFDQDTDGKTDAAQIEFSEAVDDSTVSGNPGYFEIGNQDAEFFSTNRIDETTDTDVDDEYISVTIDTGSNEVSGTEYKNVDYTDTGLTDMNGNDFAIADNIGLTQIDSASPIITSITTLDTDDDGNVDTANLVASEDVDDTTLDTPPIFKIGGTDTTSITTNTKNDDGTVATTADDGMFSVSLVDSGEASGTDTAEVNYDGTSVTDKASTPNDLLQVADGDISETDGAAPVLVSGAYRDSDNDGTVDKVDLDFSETLSSYTFNSDDWTVTENDLTGLTLSSKDTQGSGTITLVVSANSGLTGVDSGTEPSIAYNSGGSGVVEDDASPSNEAVDGTSSSLTDKAAPQIMDFQYEDADYNGKIDQFLVSFSEQVVSGSNFGPDDLEFNKVGDFSGATCASTGDVVTSATSTATVSLSSEPDSADTADSGSIDVEAVSGNSFSLEDSDANTYSSTGDGSTDQASYTDGAAPYAENAAYKDTNDDGTVDRIDVTYTEDISSSGYTDGDWSIPTPGTVDVTEDGSGSISGTNVLVQVTGDTDVTGGSTDPEIKYTAGSSITDGSNTAQTQTLTATDSAAPSFKSLTTADTDNNGRIDQITTTFTESISSGSVEAADLSIKALNNLDSGTTVNSVSGDDGDDTVTVGLSEGTNTYDTEATPTLQYSQSGGDTSKIQDGNSNLMADQESDSASDGAAPAFTVASTRDSTGNGQIDRLDITFSEEVTVSDGSSGDAIDSISLSGGYTIGAADYATTSISLTLEVVESGSPDTGTLIDPTYISGTDTIIDSSPSSNEMADSETVTGTDGAEARVVTAETQDNDNNGNIESYKLVFSETMDGSTFSDGSNGFEVADSGSAGTSEDLCSDSSLSDCDSSFSDGDTYYLSFDQSSDYQTDATPGITFTDDNIQDANGVEYRNGASSVDIFATETDSARPVALSSSYLDDNKDGNVDMMEVQFSESVDDSTFDSSAGDITFSDFGSATATSGSYSIVPSTDVDTASDSADDSTVYIDLESDAGADKTNYASASVSEIPSGLMKDMSSAGNTNVQLSSSATTSLTMTDKASPVVQTAAYRDTDRSGEVNYLLLPYTESVAESTYTDTSATINNMGSATLDTASEVDGAVPDDGSDTDQYITLAISGATSDKTAYSSVTFDSNGAGMVQDTANSNDAIDQSGVSVNDETSPLVYDATWKDTDTNGNVDQVIASFTESVDVVDDSSDDGFDAILIKDSTISHSIDAADYTKTGTSLTLDFGGDEITGTDISSLTLDYQGSSAALDYIVADGGSNNVQFEEISTSDITDIALSNTDSAKPTVIDMDIFDTEPDGKIDKAVFTFSESVNAGDTTLDEDEFQDSSDNSVITLPDGTLATLSTDDADYSGDGTSTLTVTGMTGQGTKNTASGSAGISVPQTTDFTDGTNNLVSSLDDETVTDSAAPVIKSAITDDDGAGNVDQIQVTLTESIKDSNGGDITDTSDDEMMMLPDVSAGVDTVYTGANSDDDMVMLNVSGSSLTGDTAITPNVNLVSGMIADSSTNSISADFTYTLTSDGAAPGIISQEYKDTDDDGTVNKVDLGFSETVDYTSYEDGDWSVTPNDLTSLDVSGGTASGSNTLSLTASAKSDLTGVGGVEPTIAFNDQGSVDVSDGYGNSLAAISGLTLTDKAAPSFKTLVTNDTNPNGYVDQISVVFTENVASDSVEAADLSIKALNNLDSGTTVNSVSGDDGDDTVTVGLSEGTNTYDTEATPTLQYSQSGGDTSKIQDGNSNLMADQESDSASDGAAPYAASAAYKDMDEDGTVDRVDVTYTEDISSSSYKDADWSIPTRGSVNISKDGSGSISGTDVQIDVTGDTDVTGGSAPDVKYTAGTSITDVASNDAITQTLTATDSAAPVIADAITDDNGSGDINQTTVYFTEGINDGTLSTSAFNLGTGPVDSVDTGETGDDNVAVITTSITDETSTTPDVTLAKNEVEDSNTNSIDSGFTFTDTRDGAAPAIISAATADTNKDGNIDVINTTFSETGLTGNMSSAVFSVASATVETLNYDDASDIDLFVSGISDTSSTPDVTLTADKITDGSGNSIASDQTFTGTTDSAAPVLLYSEIDHTASTSSTTHVSLTFSESINSADTASLNVTGQLSSLGSGSATITGSYSDGTLQTGNHPQVTGFGTVNDGNGNAAVLENGENVEIDTFRKDIVSGWNFVSFPVADTSDPAISEVIDTSKVDVIWSYQGGEWLSYDPDPPSNDFSNFEGGYGYMIKASESFTLAPNVNNVIGQRDNQDLPQKTVSLSDGWNLGGQFQEFNQQASASEAFASLEEGELGAIYKQSSSGTTSLVQIKTMDGTTTDNLLVGEGYWVFAKDDTKYTWS